MSAICEPVVKTDLEKHMWSQYLEADVGPNPKSTLAENQEFAVGIQKRVAGPPPHFEKHQLESQKKLIAKDLWKDFETFDWNPTICQSNKN